MREHLICFLEMMRRMKMSKLYRFECVIDLPWVNPVRVASSEEEFVTNIVTEYNTALDGLSLIHI